MPQAYDVNWGQAWGDKLGGQLREALQARQAKQLQEAATARAAEQEQYKRQQDAVENERKAQADKWEEERMKLDHQKLGLDIKEHKFKTATEEAKLRLGAASQTPQPGFEATQGAEVAPDKAPMMTPDTPEERGAFAASAPPEQIQIPADVTPSGAAINLPVQYQEQAEAQAQKKGLLEAFIKRQGMQPPRPVSVPRGGTAIDPTTGRQLYQDTRPPETKSSGISESVQKDIERLPQSWRDWNASFPTRDSFSVRNNEQASAIALANGLGKTLPTKKQGDAMVAAKATLSDIANAQKLLADPEVQKHVGKYAGKMANFLAQGWADPWGGADKVPAKVRAFRADLNRLNAEERHRLYGSALTDTESAFANGFIPGMDQSGATLQEALGAFSDDIDRSMAALWGQSPAAAPASQEAQWERGPDGKPRRKQ